MICDIDRFVYQILCAFNALKIGLSAKKQNISPFLFYHNQSPAATSVCPYFDKAAQICP